MRVVGAELVHVDGAFRPGLAVALDGGRISGVLTRSEATEDWGRVALVPGTVNAHGHAFQSLLKGFADDRSFASWRDDVLYPFSERLSGEDVYNGALFAFAEALLAGVTTTVDFFYLHDGGNDNALQVARAARDVGIRLVLARVFYDPDAPTAAPARYREPAGVAARRTLELAEALRDDPLVSVHPAPHSLHAATPDTVAAVLEVAERLGVPCHIHLAEAAYERDLVRERYGTTPVRLLAGHGLLGPRLVAVHAVWLDDEEIALLAGSGAGVVHCPGANAFLGDGIARLPEMLAAGVRVGLGPDGGCANNRQSVFDEMRTAGLMAKARLCDGAALDAPTAFRLGTSGGADLLELPVGEIAPGRLADLVALDLEDLSLQPLQELERNVVNSMQATAVARVMVGGEVVVERGRLVRVPNAEVARRVTATTSSWVRP